MNILKSLRNRNSVFPDQFEEKDIPKEIVYQLLEAANFAPSHKKTYPWRFFVFQGDKKEELGNFLADTYAKNTSEDKFSQFKQQKIYQKAIKSGAVLAICMQRDLKERVPEWEEIAATAMAVQNIWLALENFGLGGYWSTPALKDQFHNFIDLDKGVSCLGFFYMGFVDAQLAKEKILLSQNVYVKWV